MNLETFFPIYPDVDISIYHKNEFIEDISPSVYPSKLSGLLHTQRFIQKWLSSVTPYDSLFCYHEMGSGKTCAAIAVAEGLQDLFTFNRMKKAVFILKNQLLIDTFLTQLVYTCTDNKYIPTSMKINNNPPVITTEIKKKIKKYYTFETYDSITKKLEKMNDEQIKHVYNQTFLLIDEVQNTIVDNQYETLKLNTLNLQSFIDRIKNPHYRQLFRLFHIAEGTKKMIMTGTPIRDKVHQFADVLNLILPIEKQIPIENDFNNTFLYNTGHKQFFIRDDKIEELKYYLYGIVSFVKRYPNPLLTIQYMGTPIEPIFDFKKELGLIKTWKHTMSSFQSNHYLDTFNNEQGQFFDQSIQSSLFVYPNGTFGKKGYDEYIIEKVENEFKLFKWNSKMKLYNKLNSLKDLSLYSIKYSFIIQDCLNNLTKPTFILFFTVFGSGLVLFSLLLEKFGWSRATGKETSKGKRYAILSASVESSVPRSQQILNLFNHPKNKRGEYIQIILGSESISEGINLKNVQKVHLPQGDWNKTKIDQGIARATRMFSFTKETILEIYMHSASVLYPLQDPIRDSIDNYMYNICQEKQIGNKQIERICKEVAIDCPLFYNQNKTNTTDFSEECDYQVCSYSCDLNASLTFTPVDYSSYNIFWSQGKRSEFIRGLQSLFYTKNYVHLEDLDGYTMVEKLIFTQYCMIHNIIFYNSIGFQCQLNEYSNILYLSSHVVPTDIHWYNTHPSSLYKKQTDDIWIDLIKTLDIEMFNTMKNEYKQTILRQCPLWVQEVLLEISIQKNIQKEWFLSIYEKNIIHRDNVLYSILLYETTSIVRAFKHNEWVTSNDDIFISQEQVSEETEETIIHRSLENSNGIYGILSKGKFLIVDNSTKEKRAAEDRREHSRGRVCKTWTKKDIMNFITMIPVPPELYNNELIKKSKDTLCLLLQNWLMEHNLILQQ